MHMGDSHEAVWTELLKANDHVLLSLAWNVCAYSSFYCTLTVFLFQECRKKLLLLIDHRCIPRDSQCQYLIKCMGDQ